MSENLKLARGQNVTADRVGLTFDEIEEKLKISPHKRELILSELNKADEIVFFSLDKLGCMIDEKNGIPALTDKKYINRNWKIILDWIKNFVQIVIPVLALVIAYVSLTSKLDSLKTQSDKELQEVKNIMLEQKKRIEELENQSKILPNQKKDSL
ncbi:hypothetical protein [Pontimicrobium aquaticum]|uniref:Uncharacterized protein n=1 Tax=Pontimicrobium aquaticum TaxID=2565367 RepID=A0A4U0EIY9_9FLAO|nr:hypothetical protein [Pontimicrobium aquaticum]TJY31311.1 hypothetical protein E5167_15270 [Pontimicrobium aquaticum]